MPSTQRLIQQAVAWGNESEVGRAHRAAAAVATAARATPRQVVTLDQIRQRMGGRPKATRPRRAAAAGAAHATLMALENNNAALRRAREEREKNELLVEQARLDEIYDKNLEHAIAEEARLEVLALPIDSAAWHSVIDPPIKASWEYFWLRCDDGGDRSVLVKLLFAGSLFHPMFVKNENHQDACLAFEDLRSYDPLNNDEMIQGLKDGFSAYKYYARRVARNDIDVLQWCYDHRHVHDDDIHVPGQDDCKFCGMRGCCKCADGLPFFWKALELLALIQPSSAAAERVFSLLKAFWNHLQTSSLSDAIVASLYMALNGRKK